MKKKTLATLIIAGVALIVLLLVGTSLFVEVPTGHTGVVVTFGKTEDYVLEEGLHFKLPWQNVIKMDNRMQKATQQFSAFSSDIQQVSVICTVNYSVDRATSQKLYRDVGPMYYDTVMQNRIYEDVKAVFTKYTAEDLISNRENLAVQTRELLIPEMKAYGIFISSVAIEDIDFTDVFTDAVESKQVAEQTKLQAQIEQQQKVLEAEAQAQVQKIAAEADAEVKKIAADAAAYSVEVAAEAEAEANKKIAESLTEALIEYTKAQQWDGKLPSVYTSEGALSILDISSLLNTNSKK